MTVSQRLLAALALASAAALLPAQDLPNSWKEIGKPPLRAFEIPKPRRVALSNGMVLFLMEDHELPLIHATAMVRAGSRYDPPEKVGLGEVLSEAWRTGGTRTRTGDELDDFLEARAAKVETWVDTTSAGVTLSCLKGDFEPVLQAFVEVLREPVFAEEKIDLAKEQVATAIARRNDDPEEIATREARKLVYGADSPYARTPEYATLDRVEREDLIAWHRRYVRPERVLIGAVGDFDAKTLEAKLRRLLGTWPRGAAVADPEPGYSRTPRPGLYLVEREDVNQTNLRLVHLGVRRDNPDYYALEVMNQFFGGGVSSRLFSNVRSKKGLAYAVWGGVESAYDYPGLFLVGMGTKSATTAAGLEALLEEIDTLVKEPPSAAELAAAKEAIQNSFIFRFDSKEKVLRQQMRYEFFGYPSDFLERYRAGIERVTAEDVARVARRHVRKGDLAVLLVGKPSDFERPLSSFGPVTKLDVRIPPPPAEKKAPGR